MARRWRGDGAHRVARVHAIDHNVVKLQARGPENGAQWRDDGAHVYCSATVAIASATPATAADTTALLLSWDGQWELKR